MNRKKLIVLIAAVTVVTAPSTVTVWADNTTTSETANGYIESELDNNTPLYEPDESLYMSVPTAYPENGIADIRADYPANRDQNPYGTCWAFSSTGLAEFDMISVRHSWRTLHTILLQIPWVEQKGTRQSIIISLLLPYIRTEVVILSMHCVAIASG